MTDITLVGLFSTYREGDLSRAAITSVAEHVDELVVFEGPAGDQRCDDAPATAVPAGYYRSGEWLTDAEKRSEMVKWCREQWPDRPLWGIYLDGDELLYGGEHLRPLLQRVQWEDERLERSVANPDNGPTFSVPIIQVEQDGSCSRVLCRAIRLDLIRRYVVSSHVLELYNGAQVQRGFRAMTWADTPQGIAMSLAKTDEEREEIAQRMMLPPPIPGEPYTVHRPHLRHPARQALRMHEQELVELAKHGLPTS